ncbi:MAG TPA: hypothetical protein ENG16_04470 [Archaeoglobus sp.]|nr:hypothetical protein [Archaeoglobus sp.]
MIDRVGCFLGKLVREDGGLMGLRKGLEKFFDELKEFEDFQFSVSVMVKDKKIVTRSKCPIYKYFRLWCDKCCLEFIRGFARAYGVKTVRRVEKQPESDWCVFEFGE